MRTLPPALAAHLGEGVTTLCRCWRLSRRDGTVFGFTDHDRDLVVGGQAYAAGTGLEASEVESQLGFAVGGGEVSGALTSDAIAEADILAGLYDDAAVEVRLVNWADATQHLLLAAASIGEIRRADDGFVAELRDPLHRLDEERGLVYRATCSADLGDARCKVDLADPAYRATGSVGETDGALRIAPTGLDAYLSGWFSGGRLAWLSGANEGGAVEIKLHRADEAGIGLDLWRRAPRPIEPGDTFVVTAGCDKRHATCRDVFANIVNFRGFPHMPGNDFVIRTPRSGEAGLDGGSFFR